MEELTFGIEGIAHVILAFGTDGDISEFRNFPKWFTPNNSSEFPQPISRLDKKVRLAFALGRSFRPSYKRIHSWGGLYIPSLVIVFGQAFRLVQMLN